MSSSQLRDNAAHGRIVPDDYVWCEGLQDWQPAHKVKGLFPPPDIAPPTQANVAAPSISIAVTKRSAAGKFCHACGATIDQRSEICPKCGVRQADTSVEKLNDAPNKVVACLFALFLGLLGAHHFYLGHTGLGLLYLLLNIFLCWTGVVPVIFLIICLTEGLVYLTYSDIAFAKRYRRR